MMLEKLRELEAEKGFDDINIIRGTGTRTFMDEWVATDLLGRGSFGNVYRIVKPQRGVSAQECALKICEFSTPEDGELKRQEIETQKLLAGHPNAVQIEDYSLLHRAPPRVSYLLIRMERLNRLPEEGLSEHETIRLGIDICSVLEKCASLEPKLIHCDIKPANILVSNDGRYKLGDFGTAKTLGATMTYTGNRGTPLYMAPEVASFSGYDSRCDIFSLGYTMLTMLNGGRHPYEDAGDVAEILRCMYGSRKLPQINGVSPGLMKILRKMCEPSLQQRYSRASEVRRDLERFVRKKEETIRNNRLEAERQSELAVRKTKAELEKNMKAAQEAEARANLDAAEARTAKGKATVKERARIQKNIERLEARIEQIHSARRYVLEGVSYKDAMRMVKESQSDGKKRSVWGIALIALAVAAVLTVGVLALTLWLDDTHEYVTAEQERKLASWEISYEELHSYDAFSDEIHLDAKKITISLTRDGLGYIITGFDSSFKGGEIPAQYKDIPIIGIAPEAFRESSAERITLPDSLKYIGDRAFYECRYLKEITIGENVEYLGANPFFKCTSLQDINVPANCKAYKMSDGMLLSADGKHIVCSLDEKSNVFIPEKVKSIGSYAFGDCEKIKSVRIPAGVTSIGDNPFCNCPNLTSIDLDINNKAFVYRDNALYSANMTRLISSQANALESAYLTVPDGVFTIDAHAFRGIDRIVSVSIPDSVSVIGDSAFEDCVNLVEIRLPNKLADIKDSLFRNCGSLSQIELPDSIGWLGFAAFENCIKLSVIKIPEGVDGIGEWAFRGCTSLKEVALPEYLEYMGYRAFENCVSLVEFDVPEGILEINDMLFMGCRKLETVTIPDTVLVISAQAFENCVSLNNITIPEGVVSIRRGAFAYCRSLTEIYIPSSVRVMGYYVFMGCKGLSEVVIDGQIQTVPDRVFEGCSSLKAISLPDSLTRIDNGAFTDCLEMTEITIPSGVREIGKLAFKNCTSLSVRAPHESNYYINGEGINLGDYIEWIVDPNL